MCTEEEAEPHNPGDNLYVALLVAQGGGYLVMKLAERAHPAIGGVALLAMFVLGSIASGVLLFHALERIFP